MKSAIRKLINAMNSAKSTGPVTPAGKQRSSMNAITHGLTGNRMILQTHELEAYNRLTAALTRDLNPQAELERQLVQKIIDCHTRLNRIAALDGNILNFGLTQNESNADHDDALETIAAQCRSWIENADSFEKLGRYEVRISRQLLQHTHELERLQAERREKERREKWQRELEEEQEARRRARAKNEDEENDDEESDNEADESDDANAAEAGNELTQTAETKPDNTKLASFRTTSPNAVAKAAKYAEKRDSRPQPPADLAA